MKYESAAIWKSSGIPAPNIKVMNAIFKSYEYLYEIMYSGPEYRLTYC